MREGRLGSMFFFFLSLSAGRVTYLLHETGFLHIKGITIFGYEIVIQKESEKISNSRNFDLVARQKFMVRTVEKKVSDHNFLWQSSMKRILRLHPLLGPFNSRKS